MPFNVVILDEVWKPPFDHQSEWDEEIANNELGNFIHVNEGIMQTFNKRCDQTGTPELTVIFGADVISKLYPASKCKNLNEQQYKNFYCNYKYCQR